MTDNDKHLERTLSGGITAENRLVHELIHARNRGTTVEITDAHRDQVTTLAADLAIAGHEEHAATIALLVSSTPSKKAKK